MFQKNTAKIQKNQDHKQTKSERAIESYLLKLPYGPIRLNYSTISAATHYTHNTICNALKSLSGKYEIRRGNHCVIIHIHGQCKKELAHAHASNLKASIKTLIKQSVGTVFFENLGSKEKRTFFQWAKIKNARNPKAYISAMIRNKSPEMIKKMSQALEIRILKCNLSPEVRDKIDVYCEHQNRKTFTYFYKREFVKNEFSYKIACYRSVFEKRSTIDDFELDEEKKKLWAARKKTLKKRKKMNDKPVDRSPKYRNASEIIAEMSIPVENIVTPEFMKSEREKLMAILGGPRRL